MARRNRRVLTRAELKETVYARCSGLTRGQVHEIFETAVNEICDSLSGPEPLKLNSFGERRMASSASKRDGVPTLFSCASKSLKEGH
jgi:nucleoid DNA-binding protein